MLTTMDHADDADIEQDVLLTGMVSLYKPEMTLLLGDLRVKVARMNVKLYVPAGEYAVISLDPVKVKYIVPILYEWQGLDFNIGVLMLKLY